MSNASRGEVTVLVTCIGGVLGIPLIECFRKSSVYKFRVIGVDCNAGIKGEEFVDEFVQVPKGDEPGYAERVLEVAVREKVDFVFAGSDEEAEAVSRSRREFEEAGVVMSVPDHKFVELLNDKCATYQLMDENPEWVPRFREVNDMSSLHEAVEEELAQSGSAVLKNPRARGGRDVYYFDRGGGDSVSQLGTERIDFSKGSWMVMERLKRPLYDVDVMGAKGEFVQAFARERIYGDSPVDGHRAALGIELEDLATSIVKKIGLHGIIDFDLMSDVEGRLKLLEVNSRSSGSLVVSEELGQRFLENWVALNRGEELLDRRALSGKESVIFHPIARILD